MLSLQNNFLFVHIPKTAGNSIQSILKEYSADKVVCITPYQDGIERFEVRSESYATKKHSTLSEYHKEYGAATLSKLFKFTCVRNPWDRALSYYFSPHRGHVKWDKSDFIKFLNKIQPISHFIYIQDDEKSSVARAARNIDYFIRFENLQADFDVLCEKIGIPQHCLSVKNKSNKDALFNCYDQETMEIISERFSDEIAYFRYSVPNIL